MTVAQRTTKDEPERIVLANIAENLSRSSNPYQAISLRSSAICRFDTDPLPR